MEYFLNQISPKTTLTKPEFELPQAENERNTYLLFSQNFCRFEVVWFHGLTVATPWKESKELWDIRCDENAVGAKNC